ncbi:hypothetical protein [Streptomyces sp. SM12]|uniref:hypothetical protein n=1 Tax=Streptomyces sp. SM12 TaxID=1071602 RepID=UPI000CD4BE19|nr:hypothetical protein [Streptomyces sp. SM12]
MQNHRHRLQRSAAAAALVAVACLAAAGCGSDSAAGSSAQPESAVTPTETEPSPEELAEQDVLEVYQEMFRIQVEMFSVPTSHHDELNSYATGDALRDIRETAHWFAVHDSKMDGEPVLSPEVTELDLEAGTAQITDCVDNSDYVQVDADGEPLSGEFVRKPQRVVADAELGDGERWIITSTDVELVESC